MLRSVDVGTVNFAYCDYCPSSQTIHRWEVFAAPTIHKLFEALDARPFEGHVVVEAQSKRAGRMLATQHWLEAYYVLRGQRVTVFSARRKLAGTGQENSGRTNYRARKKASVALCTAWLREHPQQPDIEQFFRGTKKKDDAADACLQALAFVKTPVVSQDPAQPADPVRVVCRRPTLRQQQTGRYSHSNIKHIVVKDWACADAAGLESALRKDKKVAKAVKRHWGSAAACWAALFPQ